MFDEEDLPGLVVFLRFLSQSSVRGFSMRLHRGPGAGGLVLVPPACWARPD